MINLFENYWVIRLIKQIYLSFLIMRSKLRKWFDDLEKILNLQAESAGLMVHSDTVGEILESFV